MKLYEVFIYTPTGACHIKSDPVDLEKAQEIAGRWSTHYRSPEYEIQIKKVRNDDLEPWEGPERTAYKDFPNEILDDKVNSIGNLAEIVL